MKKMLLASKKFIQDETGVTTIEYSLIGALVAVALIGILGTLADEIEATLQNIVNALQGA